ncbi:hypothetical protein [Actinophytocola sp.]|uniref:hypothetical protein n=1 Tax=Actinophytocola sp. TaxID=1872138 RepID=UPI002D36653B|nr:hypothetical protein [Actinophytocola sp.]HYQ69067.1 hypothetical protein [Actinophytocola sp.]
MRLTDINIDDRPRPIKDAADKLTKWLGVAGSLVIALVGWGVLSAAQGDAVIGLLGVIPGVVSAVTTALTAFGIHRSAEPKVTPLSDPRDNELRALVVLPPNSKIVPKTEQGDSGYAGGNLTGGAGLAGLAAREDAVRGARSRRDDDESYEIRTVGGDVIAFGNSRAILDDPAPAVTADYDCGSGPAASSPADTGSGGDCGTVGS